MTKKSHRKFPGPVYWKLPGPVQKPSPPLEVIALVWIGCTAERVRWGDQTSNTLRYCNRKERDKKIDEKDSYLYTSAKWIQCKDILSTINSAFT